MSECIASRAQDTETLKLIVRQFEAVEYVVLGNRIDDACHRAEVMHRLFDACRAARKRLQNTKRYST